VPHDFGGVARVDPLSALAINLPTLCTSSSEMCGNVPSSTFSVKHSGKLDYSIKPRSGVIERRTYELSTYDDHER
jgi:hypothetical protein